MPNGFLQQPVAILGKRIPSTHIIQHCVYSYNTVIHQRYIVSGSETSDVSRGRLSPKQC